MSDRKPARRPHRSAEAIGNAAAGPPGWRHGLLPILLLAPWASCVVNAAAAVASAAPEPLPTMARTEPRPSGAIQSLDALTRRAEAAVREALPTMPEDRPGAPRHRVAARTPDPRLRLAACTRPLEAALPATAGGLRHRIIIQVSCPGPVRWTVLVPVTLETEGAVLVAARPLPRGAVPGAADLRLESRTLPGISDIYIRNLMQISGHHLARPLDAGWPLTRDALAADPVVRRGEAVTLVASVAGLEVRVPGRALADAGVGQPVRVQNVNSLKVLEGRADNTGVVRVDR